MRMLAAAVLLAATIGSSLAVDATPPGTGRVEDKTRVCMMQDSLQPKPGLAHEYAGKTYWLCCEMCVQAFESDLFAQQKLGRDKRLGKIDWERVNVCGGSIALGHPFAATGARQITQTLRELRRRGGEFALCTACAAGGLGAAMVLEVA